VGSRTVPRGVTIESGAFRNHDPLVPPVMAAGDRRYRWVRPLGAGETQVAGVGNPFGAAGMVPSPRGFGEIA
jgi:hypothetical protein